MTVRLTHVSMEAYAWMVSTRTRAFVLRDLLENIVEQVSIN